MESPVSLAIPECLDSQVQIPALREFRELQGKADSRAVLDFQEQRAVQAQVGLADDPAILASQERVEHQAQVEQVEPRGCRELPVSVALLARVENQALAASLVRPVSAERLARRA